MPPSTSNTALPQARFRSVPEDFWVEEIPAYAPSGHGEHLFITFEKRDLTTPDALRLLARALDADAKNAGCAGMKDKRAVTIQSASFLFPAGRDAEALLSAFSHPQLRVLHVSRHENKLKPGHLIGNRFRIVLRGLSAESVTQVREKLDELAKTGVPNAFGPQRFGRDGDNPERALSWVSGKSKPPRDKREQRFLFSALQSLMFNRVLDLRVKDGSWKTVLAGDLAKKHDTGGLFLVPSDEEGLKDAKERAFAGLVSATGPMFGAKMRWPEGAAAELERQVLCEAVGEPERLDGFRALGEGTRRALRLWVSDLRVLHEGEKAPGDNSLSVHFVLPKGSYATTVLGCACALVEGHGRNHGDESHAKDADAETSEGGEASLED